MSLLRLIQADVKLKAQWRYQNTRSTTVLKTLVADGTAAMILYRLMQSCRRWRLEPLAMLCNKFNAMFCQCVIGRGAEFGPGFVLNHSQGIVINASVRGGERILIEHQVTIGAEQNENPILGS